MRRLSLVEAAMVTGLVASEKGGRLCENANFAASSESFWRIGSLESGHAPY